MSSSIVVTRRAYSFPDTRAVPKATLLDQSLTSFAQNFDTVTITSHPAISDLPLHLKEHLLSYIAVHWLPGITVAELQALLVDSDPSDASLNISYTNIQRLDLSHSIGSTISLDSLGRKFTFGSLTHTCLAHPGPEISWPSLLTFAEKVPSLTHLSLAYWPKPGSGTEESKDSDEWTAASLTLRRLSRLLPILQYLDLEGCNDWRYALLLGPNCGPDWIGGWKHVHSVNLSQGPMPMGVTLEGGSETEKWIQGEVLARHVENFINRVRRERASSSVQPIYVEHGWDNVMIDDLVDTWYERDCPLGSARRPGQGSE